MSITWIIFTIIGIIIFWFLLKMTLGFLLPPKVTGKYYIRQKLKKAEIDKSIVSDECLIELVKMAVGSARLSKTGYNKHFNTEFINFLNAHISIILTHINNPDEFDNNYEDGFYKEIFERHNVPTIKTLGVLIENCKEMTKKLNAPLAINLSIDPDDPEFIQMNNWLKEVNEIINNTEILLKQENSFNAYQFKQIIQLNKELLAGMHGLEYGKAKAKKILN